MTVSTIEKRLADLGLQLPTPPKPPAIYTPWYRTHDVVFVAGMPPLKEDGTFAFVGKLGSDLTVEEGCASARLGVLNALAHLKVACGGDLNQAIACVRLVAYVHCTPEFRDIHLVADAASSLIATLFGPGRGPTRTSLGCASLPAGIATEIETAFHLP